MAEVSEPRIQKTPGVLGGKACVRNTRIPVWLVVLNRKCGQPDDRVLANYPALVPADLDACWDYYRDHPIEIEQAIWFNDTAANVPDGVPPPTWVLVAGRLLGLSDAEMQDAFEPPLPPDAIVAAWASYRADPIRIERDIATLRQAG